MRNYFQRPPPPPADYLILFYHPEEGVNVDLSHQPMTRDQAIEVYRDLGGEGNPNIVLVQIVTYWEVPE